MSLLAIGAYRAISDGQPDAFNSTHRFSMCDKSGAVDQNKPDQMTTAALSSSKSARDHGDARFRIAIWPGSLMV